MPTYTLSELATVAEHGLQRDALRAAARANPDEQDLWRELSVTEAARDHKLGKLYLEYGEQYGDAIERYAQVVLSAHPAAAARRDGEPTYELGQLVWVEMTGLFPGDMQRDMLAGGCDAAVAQGVAREAAAAGGDLIRLWRALAEPQRAALQQHVTHCLASYRPGWPHCQRSVQSTSP